MTGNPYFDTMSLKIEGPKTVQIITKKDGKIVGKERDVVSEDGNQFTSEWTGRTAPDSPEMSAKAVHTRVAPGPADAHAISGSWRTEKATNASENITTVTFNLAARQK